MDQTNAERQLLDRVRAVADQSTMRIILGKPLSHQQWVQHGTADVQTRLAAAHALYQQALRQADNRRPYRAASPARARAPPHRSARVPPPVRKPGGCAIFLT
jgi:alkylation response protein AidB-like acyl-CoA dehydrogenase